MSVPEALTGLTDAATNKQGAGEIRFYTEAGFPGKDPVVNMSAANIRSSRAFLAFGKIRQSEESFRITGMLLPFSTSSSGAADLRKPRIRA